MLNFMPIVYILRKKQTININLLRDTVVSKIILPQTVRQVSVFNFYSSVIKTLDCNFSQRSK